MLISLRRSLGTLSCANKDIQRIKEIISYRRSNDPFDLAVANSSRSICASKMFCTFGTRYVSRDVQSPRVFLRGVIAFRRSCEVTRGGWHRLTRDAPFCIRNGRRYSSPRNNRSSFTCMPARTVCTVNKEVPRMCGSVYRDILARVTRTHTSDNE